MSRTSILMALEHRDIAQRDNKPPMKWKRDMPAEPGFFYWRGGRLHGDQVEIVQISRYKNRDGFNAQRLGLGFQPGDQSACDLDDIPDGWWAGPLPQPYP